MDKNQIIIIAVTVVAVAIRLYMKYMKKKQVNTGSERKTSFPSGTGGDEYEPYSKK
jgi:Tfp pilus assembly major pilin PilA